MDGHSIRSVGQFEQAFHSDSSTIDRVNNRQQPSVVADKGTAGISRIAERVSDAGLQITVDINLCFAVERNSFVAVRPA